MVNSSSVPISDRGLSLRGQGPFDSIAEEISRFSSKFSAWDESKNPNGLINVSGAHNHLMEDFMEDSYRKIFQEITYPQFSRYGHGDSSAELKTAMASYFNRYFVPASPIKEEDFTVTDGTSSLIENVVWNLADSGDGIMYLTPTYSYYPLTFKARANLNTVGVSLGTEDQFREESAEKVVARFEERYEQATKDGVKVKLVLICNPTNPQGRFYSRKTLEGIVGFCRKYRLHLVSDEIFAMSCFSTEDKMDGFTSALSLPDEENRNDIHVIYGASKDFGMGGLRLGFLVTKNKELRNLAAKIGFFARVPTGSDAFFARFIGDKVLVDKYLRTQQVRLAENYKTSSALLIANGIPFSPANGALFIWVDLSKWLVYFKGVDFPTQKPLGQDSREIQLCKWLINHGIVLSPGEASESELPGWFRFTITVGQTEVEPAVRRLGSALNKLRQKALESEMNKASL